MRSEPDELNGLYSMIEDSYTIGLKMMYMRDYGHQYVGGYLGNDYSAAATKIKLGDETYDLSKFETTSPQHWFYNYAHDT